MERERPWLADALLLLPDTDTVIELLEKLLFLLPPPKEEEAAALDGKGMKSLVMKLPAPSIEIEGVLLCRQGKLLVVVALVGGGGGSESSVMSRSDSS